MDKPYYYIRYRWLQRVDFNLIFAELSDYKIEPRHLPEPQPLYDFSFFKDEREGYKVTSDNLYAFIHPLKAMMYQLEPLAFTARDLKLREIILKYYPRKRATPVTTIVNKEPTIRTA